MPVTIYQAKAPDGLIPVRDLRRGQIARIVSWDDNSARYRGMFIQGCHDGDVQEIGGEVWWHKVPQNDECRIRVLPDGTLLQVTQNEGIK